MSLEVTITEATVHVHGLLEQPIPIQFVSRSQAVEAVMQAGLSLLAWLKHDSLGRIDR